VVWIGAASRSEFQAARQLLDEQTCLDVVADVAQAIDYCDTAQSVDLAIVAQAFPGEFSREAIDRLRRRHPLLPLWGLLGSWCEGEMRSGAAWHGVPRVYWHQFELRMGEQLARLRAGQTPQWIEPLTASEEERFLAFSDRPLARGDGLVVVDSLNCDSSQFLAQTCRRHGYQVVEVTRLAAQIRGVRVAVWDCEQFDRDIARLESLVNAVWPAPVVALVSFPRIDQVRAALRAGAAAVLSKPLRLSEFLSLLSRVPSP
jgi:DNA-binding NarL/FixJ family response regulator